MKEIKASLIRLGEEKPELQHHIAAVLDAIGGGASKTASQSLFFELVDERAFHDLLGRYIPEIQKPIREIYMHFYDALTMSRKEAEAFQRFRGLMEGRPLNQGAEMNELLKIATALGIDTKFLL